MLRLLLLLTLSAGAVCPLEQDDWSFEDSEEIGPSRRFPGRIKLKSSKKFYRFKLSDDAGDPAAERAVEEVKLKSGEAKGTDGSKEKKSWEEISGGKPKVVKPPKEDKCEDALGGDRCKKFEAFCPMFLLRAHVFCKKTCKLCKEDEPKGLTFEAEVPELKGKFTLKQCAPRTTTFLTICLDKGNKVVEKDKEYAVEIHEYATIKKGGVACKDIGPGFNPYNVNAGKPRDAMKKVGDLGEVKFLDSPPKAWPKEELKCKEGEIGAYALFNHVDLYTISSTPAFKPIVIHEKKEAGASKPAGEGDMGKGLVCGRLMCKDDKGKGKEKKKKSGGKSKEDEEGSKEASEGMNKKGGGGSTTKSGGGEEDGDEDGKTTTKNKSDEK